jgi:protein gp37
MTPQGPRWTGKVVCRDDQLPVPTRWRQPKRIFVGDRGDLFHEAVPDGFVMDVWRIMALSHLHKFLLLTKRPDRMAAWVAKWADVRFEDDWEPKLARGPQATREAHHEGRAQLFADMIERWGEPPAGAAFPTYDWAEGMRGWPTVLPHVWLGTSVCTAAEKGKIDQLRAIPAAHRFLSIEPLLEDLGELDLTGIDWVIVGGESGPRARPMHPQWARNVRDQCVAAAVPFFFKQWGQWLPMDQPWEQDSPKALERPDERWLNFAGGHGFHGEAVWRVRSVGAKRAGRELDGCEWDQVPA